MEALLVLLLLFLIAPVFLFIIGVFMLAFSDELTRKRGKRLLLIGLIWLVAEILIGYSICSNMRFN